MTTPSEIVPRAGQTAAVSPPPNTRAEAEARLVARGKAHTSSIPRRPPSATAPLSFAQERLYLLDRLAPGSSAYNVTRALRVAATLDGAALQKALDQIVERHEILRTAIELVDGVPLQRVRDAEPVELVEVDLRGEADADARAHALAVDFARRPFDLSKDVLIRSTLIHVAPQTDLLVIVSHHGASDEGSGRVLLAEIDALYRAAVRDESVELPELPIQYSDFAAWQRGHLSGGRLDRLTSYWREALAGAQAELPLPADRARPAVQSYRGTRHEFELPAHVLDGVGQLARANGATPFMVLVAAFQTLLHRCTGVDDIVVGTPISGRHFEETKPLIGLFANTLPLRTNLGGDPTVSELIGRVRHTAVGAFAHQELPFEKLVAELNPERDLSRSPIFQALLVLDTYDGGELAGAPVTRAVVDAGWSKFDLTLAVVTQPDGGAIAFIEYASDLFEAATIERMARHFSTLVEALVAHPQHRVSELQLIDDEERGLLLDNAHGPHLRYERTTVDRLFARVAREHPTAPALQYESDVLTYAELDRRVEIVARELRHLGVGPGTIVAICCERSSELVVGLLATLRAGGAYVPVDPAFPAERQRLMLEHSGARVILTQDPLTAALPAEDATIVRLDREWPAEAGQTDPADTADWPVPNSDDLAYVIYTSGSTGVPKGVEIPHRALVNFLASMRQSPGIDVADVLVAVTTPSFDIAALELFLPLVSGARVVVAPQETVSDPKLLAALLDEVDATVMQATPTTWRMLVESGWAGRDGLKALCGGEALPQALAEELLARGLELWNMYGPTETTIWSTVDRLRGGGERVSIGRPIANTSVYVLDQHGELAPIGVAGELHIGGDGVARGYRDDPVLTARRFVADPFDATSGARLYKTGDLARVRADGRFECLGRLDFQTKLRGHRVELGEIETALTRHPGVNAAVAVVREDEPGDARLVAYVVPGNDPPTGIELRRHAAETLPGYMVPSVVVTLDALPLTPNGKIDRPALPKPSGDRPAEREFIAPSTPVEETLADIWQEVLHVSQVGVEDDFFELGGTSLLAVQMLARVHDALDIELLLGTVFEHPTIAGLAKVIAGRLLEDEDAADLEALIAEVSAVGEGAR